MSDILDGWDDELTDWAEDDRVFNAEVEATLKADNVCIRPPEQGYGACSLHYDHTGKCQPAPTATSAAHPGGRR